MRSIHQILEAERLGLEITPEEKKYLQQYKKQRHFRHATGYISHARKLPKEEDVNRN